MAKKKQKVQVSKIEQPLLKLNGLFNKAIDTISYNTFGSDNSREEELNILTKQIDNVLYNELQELTDFTGDDISSFLVKLFNDYDTNDNMSTALNGIEDIFKNESGAMFEIFKERYKNQNLQYDDLELVTSQLYELEEAVDAFRDAIVTSDDITQTISRTLTFKNIAHNSSEISTYINSIEKIEAEYKLHHRLKNHIIPKTLINGKYYVYTIPYHKLLEDKQRDQLKKQKLTSNLMESFAGSDVVDQILTETKSFLDDGIKPENKKAKAIIESYMKDIKICNDEDIAIPVLEGELSNFSKEDFEKLVKKSSNMKVNNKKVFTDGVVDGNLEDFSSIKGCYVKLLSPKKVIPVKILDSVIGYYYIHSDEALETSKSLFSTSLTGIKAPTNSENIEKSFLGKIADKIVQSFDKKFLEENSSFKELIVNSLMFHDIHNKQLKFQFIPIDYITEFKVNEDEEGEGRSILLKSLFYAKLYLSLLTFKMLTILSNSNDTKINYVKQSGIDKNVANKVQEIARSIKSRQINFMDLLNYNSMISKVGANRQIFMPVGKSGERSIEFDILSGQDVQLDTDLMQMLRTGFINATGVPAVITNYVNEADYAKTLVMANSKFLGRVGSVQLDFNVATTEMYKKIMRFSGMALTDEMLTAFEYVLNPPKSLNNMNMTDLVNNAEQTIMYMIKSVTGENSDQTEDDNRIKDILFDKLSREMLPMLPWGVADQLRKDAKLEVVKKSIEKSLEETNEE